MVESQKNFALFALQINDCIKWDETNWVEYRGKQTGVCSFNQHLFTGLTTGSTWLGANLDQHSHTKSTLFTVTPYWPALQPYQINLTYSHTKVRLMYSVSPTHNNRNQTNLPTVTSKLILLAITLTPALSMVKLASLYINTHTHTL